MKEIQECEERLRAAMLTCDIDALDDLLADDLVFVTHTGQTIGKADDLDAPRRGAIVLTRLDFRKQDFHDMGNVVVTIALAEIAGEAGGMLFEDVVTYLRVWRRGSDGRWQVAAGQATRTEAR